MLNSRYKRAQPTAQIAASEHGMSDENPKNRMSRLNRYIQSLCGLYSRIARQLNVDRSYVSRVARGERRSPEIEQALVTEFNRVTSEQDPAQIPNQPA
jgi:transcriptional regulator with XRE-family HTH domain